ncbi:MAG TPA: TRAP transporter fused permease subunit [Hyphomicrobiaceae bacterium]|nr:TRAP transporter fused permease subunit [Hyphomicrobiaceae bacterium]
MNAEATVDAGAPSRIGMIRRAIEGSIVAYALFHLFTSLFGTYEPLTQRSLFLGGGVGLIFLGSAADLWARSRPAAARDAMLAIIAIYSGLHVTLHADRFMDIMSDLTLLDMIMCVLMIVASLEAARRTIGWSLPAMAVASLAFYLFGHYFISGNWQPPRVSAETAAMTLYASTQGLFGMMADIGTRVVAIYVIFGSLLMAVGAGNVFMRAATFVAGRTFGGPAKVAVVTSALFGTISGSAVANVMSVGTITIPTMIRAGYRRDFAAGIEASASAGGQIMPPVMGAGAFIMAELLNISYASVALAAAIPAILYFSAIYFSIDCYARANALNPMRREDVPRARDLFLSMEALPAFGPLFLLAWMLFSGYTPTLAGGAATLVMLALALACRLVACVQQGRTRDIGSECLELGRKIWAGLIDGGKGVIVIAVLLAAASMLVTVLSASGLGVKFSQLLLGFGGDYLVGVLLISALLCIMLGMDVPTTASYLLTASVAAPALVKLGLAPLTAHLFIFYFAILSAITPPVCASVYAAATIVGENFWQVAGQALRIAGAVFFIPFMMVYRPELMLQGTAAGIAYHVAISWAAIVAISGGSIGYLLGPLGWPGRVYLYVAAAALFYPSTLADLVGAGLVLAFLAWRWWFSGNAQSAHVSR